MRSWKSCPRKHFEDLGYGFSLYGTPSRQIKYIPPKPNHLQLPYYGSYSVQCSNFNRCGNALFSQWKIDSSVYVKIIHQLKMTVDKIILWWSRFWHPAKRKLKYLLEVKYRTRFNDLLGLLLNVDQLRKGALKITVNFFSRPASVELEGTQDISSPV